MATAYPNKVDTSTELPITVDRQTGVDAIVVNRLRDAIIAIEQELGVNPSGDQSTVKDRFDVVFGLIADLQGIADNVVGPTGPKGDKGDTGSQGIQGEIGPTGPSGSNGSQGIQGEIGPAGPSGSSSALTLEVNAFDVLSGQTYGTITIGNTNSIDLGAIFTNFGLHTYDFVFPAAWTGGDVTVTYIAKDGSTVSDVITTPGIGGGTVNSTKVVVYPLTLTCASPASGTFELRVSNNLCLSNAPITDIYTAWAQQSTILYPVDKDLTNGFCKLSLTSGGSPEDLVGEFFVIYKI